MFNGVVDELEGYPLTLRSGLFCTTMSYYRSLVVTFELECPRN
jgi:hypothetical protein